MNVSAPAPASSVSRPGPQPKIGSLLVFSDDWGRHPSSCQHLVRHFLPEFPVLWVNTIGTRAPRLDIDTVLRASGKLRQWLRRSSTRRGLQNAGSAGFGGSHPNLTVCNPVMWPWFTRTLDRRLNRWLLTRALRPRVQQLPQPVVALTTLPITADLPGALPVDRWVYYCVDDFSEWPGLDRETLRRMDRKMIRSADALVAVSEALQGLIAAEGRTSVLLTHGVDPDFWNPSRAETEACRTPERVLCGIPGPRVVFWGVVDRRLDPESLHRLSAELNEGTIVLIGPQQNPESSILSLPNVVTLPAQPLHALPAVARDADVLVMPYADLPVTRAMQPLKLKEYLATGRPVVVNKLPATEAWSDCLDTARNAAEFSALVRQRLCTGLPAAHRQARERLRQESWESRAAVLREVLERQPAGSLFGSVVE